MLPTIEDDPDAAWALKPERVDSGESSDEEEFTAKMPETETETPASASPTTLLSAPPLTTAASRERKSSLTAVTLLTPKTPSSSGPRHIIKELARVAQELQMIDPETIAQQITLVQVKAFLAITVRLDARAPRFSTHPRVASELDVLHASVREERPHQ